MTEEAYLEKQMLYKDYTRKLVMMELVKATTYLLENNNKNQQMTVDEMDDYLGIVSDNIILRVTNANNAIEEAKRQITTK